MLHNFLFLPIRRYFWALIGFAGITGRLIHTGYDPIRASLVALTFATVILYILASLYSSSLNISGWNFDIKQSAKNMFLLLVILTLILISLNFFYPIRR